MKTHIVLIYVDNFINGHDVAKNLANHTFVDLGRLLEILGKELIFDSDVDVSKTSIGGSVYVYTLDDFITDANNQGIDLEGFWITYVTLNN